MAEKARASDPSPTQQPSSAFRSFRQPRPLRTHSLFSSWRPAAHSMEELLEGRKAAAPARTGVGLAHSFPPHLSRGPPGTSGGAAPAMQDQAWKPWGNHAGGATRDTATTSAATMSDVFPSSGDRARRDADNGPHHHSADGWRWRETTAATQQQRHPPASVAGRCVHPAPSPTRPPPPPQTPQPPLSASSLRASLRRRGSPTSPSPAAATIAAAAVPTDPGPSLRPRPRTRSPSELDDGSWRRETRISRPQPRQAPSEDGGDPRGGGAASDEDRWAGRGSESGSEWWAGGGGGDAGPRGLDEGPGLDDPDSSGVSVRENTHRSGKPLHVVSL